jgi:hypothetical protein
LNEPSGGLRHVAVNLKSINNKKESLIGTNWLLPAAKLKYTLYYISSEQGVIFFFFLLLQCFRTNEAVKIEQNK